MNWNSVRNRPMPSAPVSSRMRQVDEQAGIHQQRDRAAVAGERRLVAQRAILRAAGVAPKPHLARHRPPRRRAAGADMDLAARAVDDDRRRRSRRAPIGVGDLARPRGCRARGRRSPTWLVGAALLEHEAAQPLAVVVEQLGRPHGCGRPGWRSRAAASRAGAWSPAEQLAQQPVGEIVEIVQPLAQIGVGLAQHAGAVSVCTRSTAASAVRPVRTASSQPVHPAAVVGEHAVGLEHLAMLAAVGDVAVLEHVVDRTRSVAIAVVEPLRSLRRRPRR